MIVLPHEASSPCFCAALQDLAVWQARVLARIFYPDVPAAAASGALAESLALLSHEAPEGPYAVIDRVVYGPVRKMMVGVRDLGAALAAQAVSKHEALSYESYLSFMAQCQELGKILRGLEHHFLQPKGGGASAQRQTGQDEEPSTLLSEGETLLQKYMREKAGMGNAS